MVGTMSTIDVSVVNYFRVQDGQGRVQYVVAFASIQWRGTVVLLHVRTRRRKMRGGSANERTINPTP